MQVASQVSVLFILIVLGWIARKANFLDDVAIGRFSSFVLNITLPALILMSMQRSFSRELLSEAGAMMGLSSGIYAASFGLAALYPFLISAGKKERGVHRYALVFSNVGYMGYPVAEAVLGKGALFHLAVYNIPFNLLAFSIGAWLIARDGNGRLRLSWKMLTTPCVAASVAGFLFFLLSVEYPAPLASALNKVY